MSTKFLSWFVYCPPVYAATTFRAWIPFATLDVELSPAIGIGFDISRHGITARFSPGITIALSISLPPSWQREVFMKRDLLWAPVKK